MAFQPLDTHKHVERYRNHLPHWRQEGVTVFVTFRLGDSIPQEQLREWEVDRGNWLKAHGVLPGSGLEVEDLPDQARHEYHQRFSATFHRWLDAGHGACWLRRPECAALVGEALLHFDSSRYAMEAFVVMPNHAHVLVTPHPDHDMSSILHSWKSYTSNQLNAVLGLAGAFWQKESYDHLVRSSGQFEHYRRYIHGNPGKAGLRAGEYLWWDALGEPKRE